MTDPQYEAIEHQLHCLRSTLEIVAQDECHYILDGMEQAEPCECNPCRARGALRQSREWRYQGAMDYRVHDGHNPRETRIIMAWKKDVDDRRLGGILDQNREKSYPDRPSARDWYVATSVVQWLATNVGMSVLKNAGFDYTRWDEDREQRENK